MRTDKISHLKQRLRQGADSFDFNALINGVSTIEEEKKEAAVEDTPQAPTEPVVSPPIKQEEEQPNPVPSFSYGENHIAQQSIASGEPIIAETAKSVLRDIKGKTATEREGAQIQDERLKMALESLVAKLRTEIISFQVSLEDSDTEQAGFSLVRINHLLDLLNSLDPEGSVSRSLRIDFHPPQDTPWPKSVWSVVELAESPLSGLFPPQADDMFIREILNAAWDAAPN
jgi:hypothetical protein